MGKYRDNGKEDRNYNLGFLRNPPKPRSSGQTNVHPWQLCLGWMSLYKVLVGCHFKVTSSCRLNAQ